LGKRQVGCFDRRNRFGLLRLGRSRQRLRSRARHAIQLIERVFRARLHLGGFADDDAHGEGETHDAECGHHDHADAAATVIRVPFLQTARDRELGFPCKVM